MIKQKQVKNISFADLTALTASNLSATEFAFVQSANSFFTKIGGVNTKVGLSGSGIANRIALFTTDGTTLGISNLSQSFENLTFSGVDNPTLVLGASAAGYYPRISFNALNTAGAYVQYYGTQGFQYNALAGHYHSFLFGNTEGLRMTSGGLRVPNGSVSAPSLSFINKNQTGFFLSGNDVACSIDGVERMKIGSMNSGGTGMRIRGTDLSIDNMSGTSYASAWLYFNNNSSITNDVFLGNYEGQLRYRSRGGHLYISSSNQPFMGFYEIANKGGYFVDFQLQGNQFIDNTQKSIYNNTNTSLSINGNNHTVFFGFANDGYSYLDHTGGVFFRNKNNANSQIAAVIPSGIETIGLKLTPGAGVGKVAVSDASGNATWQDRINLYEKDGTLTSDRYVYNPSNYGIFFLSSGVVNYGSPVSPAKVAISNITASRTALNVEGVAAAFRVDNVGSGATVSFATNFNFKSNDGNTDFGVFNTNGLTMNNRKVTGLPTSGATGQDAITAEQAVNDLGTKLSRISAPANGAINLTCTSLNETFHVNCGSVTAGTATISISGLKNGGKIWILIYNANSALGFQFGSNFKNIQGGSYTLSSTGNVTFVGDSDGTNLYIL
jgi:hypothetical protein